MQIEQSEQLQQPLDISVIKHRPGGGGKQLKYISGHTAISTANRIFGFGQWGYKVVARSHEVIEDDKKGRIEFYTADIELSVVGAAFPFPGDGIGIVTAPFTVEMHEKARKEATTDALKRALRHYGDQLGLCLYNEDEYVDAGNGTLVQVRDVTPNRQIQAPKRIVDARSPSPQLPAPEQHGNEQKARLNALYQKAQEAGQIEKGLGKQEGAAAFLKWASSVLEATVASAGQLTDSRLETLEAFLSAEDAA